MTQSLPSVPAPTATPSPARSDGSRASTDGDGFDGMLREQMQPAASAPESPAEVTDAAPESEAEAPEGALLLTQTKPDLQLVPAEVLPDAMVQVPIDVEVQESAGSPPPPAAVVAATVPGVTPDETAPALESLDEEPAPRIARDGAAAVALPAAGRLSPGTATKGSGSTSVAPGSNPVPQADPEAAARAQAAARAETPARAETLARAETSARPELAMSGSAEAELADAPGAARAATPATGGQTVAGFATALHAAASGAPRVQVLEPVMVPVADPDWGAAVGTRLAVSVAQGVHSASIALNPQDLGPLQLTLVVNEDEASVTFVSNHAAVREAIEAALPRLREMLADEGITLTDVDVFSGGDRPGEGREGMTGDGRRDDAAEDGSAPSPGLHAAAPARNSLVDTFA